MVCCHKFQPAYLTGTRYDTLMDLVVYDKPALVCGEYEGGVVVDLAPLALKM